MVFAEARGKVNFYKPFFLKASLRPDFSALSFPEQFDRARRNSIDLFTVLYDQVVIKVEVFLNERALGLYLEKGDLLVFKLFGNRSNIAHFNPQGAVVDLFNNKLTGDQNLSLTDLHRPLSQTYEVFLENNGAFETIFPTFGKVVKAYIEEEFKTIEQPKECWELLENTVQKLENPTFYLTRLNHIPTLSLLPVGHILEEFTDPLEAANRFYYAFARRSTIDKEKADWTKQLRKRLVQTENYLANSYKKLILLEEGRKNEEMGHILMANLHQISERSTQVELYDFYRDLPIIIKLKKDLSPQKNAEVYYRKAKNEKIEIEKLQESIAAREAELITLQQHLNAIDSIELLKELRGYLKKNGFTHAKTAIDPVQLFKKLDFQGFVILIGKNAKNNDLLTQQFAFKEDLWLHARDVSGSHVIIKYQAGKPFPVPVIERAAQIAAFYSKRRTDSLCPVIVTPKKYVRKPKGLPPGAVLIEKEEVILVEPLGEGNS